MKTVFFLLLLFNIIILSHAQTKHQSLVASEENLLRVSKLSGTVYTTKMDELYEGVRGTPYLYDEWKLGNVYLTDNKLIKSVNIKYNIYTDELLYLNSSSGDSLIINRSMIDKFEIIDDLSDDLIVMEVMNLKPGNREKKTYVRVIYDGKSKFILKYVKTLINAFYEGAYAAGNKYDEYTDKYQYYLLTDENIITKIKLNKKSVIKVLSDRERKIKAFVNEQGLTLDNEDDVVRVLEYYDRLTD